jgi:predicted lipoprotein with Yx(FWY)xxD motif
MKRFSPVLFALAAIGALVVAVSAGSARTARPQVASASALTVRTTTLGKTLTDAKGRTLYLFEADRRNVSKLSRAGFAVWPAFASVHIPRAEGGVQRALIGTTTGRGVKQVTYNGHPLYYYIGDRKPGSTQGQGLKEFGALWYVLSPSGAAVVHAPLSVSTTRAPAPAAPAPAPAGGGYGY